jgi:hypothetical protein
MYAKGKNVLLSFQGSFDSIRMTILRMWVDNYPAMGEKLTYNALFSRPPQGFAGM